MITLHEVENHTVAAIKASKFLLTIASPENR